MMNISYKNRFFLAGVLSLLCFSTCGKKDSDDDEIPPAEEPILEEPPPPPPSTPPVTPPAPAPTEIWIATNNNKAIARYSYLNGVVTDLGTIDLSSYFTAAGTVTSLTFLTKDVLLATLDPGAAGEKIIRIDLSGNSVTAINANWYQDATNLNNVSLYSLVMWSSSKLMALKTTSVEAVSYNIGTSISARLTTAGAAFIPNTLTPCNTTTPVFQVGIKAVTPTGGTRLLAGVSAAAPRLYVYDGIDSTKVCTTSYNFAVALGLTAAHIPTGMTQTPNGKIYVRYQHATLPMVVSYDFDGTSFTNPTLVSDDSGVLDLGTTSRTLTLLDSSNLLFASWTADAIYKLNLTNMTTEPVIKTFLTADVNAITIRPNQ